MSECSVGPVVHNNTFPLPSYVVCSERQASWLMCLQHVGFPFLWVWLTDSVLFLDVVPVSLFPPRLVGFSSECRLCNLTCASVSLFDIGPSRDVRLYLHSRVFASRDAFFSPHLDSVNCAVKHFLAQGLLCSSVGVFSRNILFNPGFVDYISYL